MARDHHLPPSAACLSASMRDLGYSLETAIADIVDNSISANATAIDIVCNLTGAKPSLAIIDNGWGMSSDEIVEAMRHGAANPKEERGPKDLGRFGLGLKTASFSQCRTLTVTSAKDGSVSGAVWSLDRIDALDDWMLSILADDDLAVIDYSTARQLYGPTLTGFLKTRPAPAAMRSSTKSSASLKGIFRWYSTDSLQVRSKAGRRSPSP